MALPFRNITSYNGYRFSQLVETVSIIISPVMDEANRTVIYNKYSIRLRDKILAGLGGSTGTSTASVQQRSIQARTLLTKQGGVFVYTDRGVGDISINTGNVKDIAYGPKVTELSLSPSPGSHAVTIEWSVEICIPECPAAKFAFALMSFNYKLRFTIGRYGETTRNINGYVEIPANRLSGAQSRTLSDSVDLYREKIYPLVPPNFRRTNAEYAINDAKTRMDFSFTDEEVVGLSPPAGIVDAKASHSISSAQQGLVMWVNQIDARYWVGRGFNKGLAVEAFLALVADRVEFSRKQLGRHASSFVALSLRMAEPEIYAAASDPTAVFSLTYTFSAKIFEILGSSGLWRPVRFGDWNTWASSMNGILGPRGYANLQFKIGDDKITDLCDPAIKVPQPQPPKPPIIEGILRGTAGICPPPADSWLNYDVQIETEGDDGTIETARIPKAPLKQQPRGTASVPGFPNTGDDSYFWNPAGFEQLAGWVSDFQGLGSASQKQGKLESSMQQRAAPIVYIYLVGKATRICYPVTMPSLVKVDNMEPKVANRTDKGEGFKQAIIANVGHPIYAAKWRIRYAVPSGYIQKMPIPANPIKDSVNQRRNF